MRRLIILMLVALAVPDRGGFAQGYRISFDHSIAVLNLRPAETNKILFEPLSLPLPAYPNEMMQAAVTGEATIRFLVLEDGSVTDVSIVTSSNEAFSFPAKEAAAKWKFRPVNRTNETTSLKVWMKCRIVFRLE